MSVHRDTAAMFERERPRLLAVAFQILGFHADADDIVQNASVGSHRFTAPRGHRCRPQVVRDCGRAELAWSRISSTVHWSLEWVPYLLPARVEEKTAGIKRRDRKGNVFEMRFESVLSTTAHDQRLILYTDTSPDNAK